MEVKLINYTPNALELLLYTKNTRLQGEQTLDDICGWPMEKKLENLSYMRDTIKSSWEFVDYIFEINGVSRAFTHQLVRTRNGSYAQESHRSGDLSGHEFISFDEDKYGEDVFLMNESIIADSFAGYERLIKEGVERQDARGVMPTNISTNIISKFNLRTLHQMAEVRLCTRTQGEYQDVFRAMKEAVVEVHPWVDNFINVFCANHGTCCFPRYTECPAQELMYNNTDRSSNHKNLLKIISEFHKDNRHSANPIAKNGGTM